MPFTPKVRALIVDDDPSIVKIIRNFVAEMSFETIDTVYPQEAIDMVSREPVDIAVIDLHMPQMEGIDLMKSLHRLNGDIQVIFVSGDLSPDSVSDAISNGAYDYIWKPIDFRQLGDSLTALREQLLRRSGL